MLGRTQSAFLYLSCQLLPGVASLRPKAAQAPRRWGPARTASQLSPNSQSPSPKALPGGSPSRCRITAGHSPGEKTAWLLSLNPSALTGSPGLGSQAPGASQSLGLLGPEAAVT